MIKLGKKIINKPISSPSPSTVNPLLVNLLPQELILKRKQNSKLNFISKLSVVTLMVFVFLTSVTLALRISQSFDLQSAQKSLARAEGRVTSLKSSEQQAFVLKQRLTSIGTLLGGDSKRKEIFNLIVYLTPADILISEVVVDKEGNMALTLNTANLVSLERLFSDIENSEKNAGLIKKVTLDSLTVGKDSNYRLSLKIIPKG